MSFIRYIILFVALSFTPLFAQTNAATHVDIPAQTQTVQSKGDAVLDFILKKAEKYSGTLEEGIAQAVDFAKEQTPIAVQEFLKWRMYQAIWYIIFPFVFIIILAFTIRYSWRFANKDREYMDGAEWIPFVLHCILLGVLTIIAIVCIGENAPTIIQIHVAPRVYLIEEAMKLVRH